MKKKRKTRLIGNIEIDVAPILQRPYRALLYVGIILAAMLVGAILNAEGLPPAITVDAPVAQDAASLVNQFEELAPGWFHAVLETLGGAAALIWLARLKKVMRILALLHTLVGMVAKILFASATKLANVEEKLKEAQKPKAK